MDSVDKIDNYYYTYAITDFTALVERDKLYYVGVPNNNHLYHQTRHVAEMQISLTKKNLPCHNTHFCKDIKMLKI